MKEIRRQKLREWFANKTLPEKEKSYLSQLIGGKASFGEKAARRLEKDYGMPELYLDTDTKSTEKEKVFTPPIIPETAGIVTYDDVSELDPDKYVLIDRYDIKLSAGGGNVQWIVNEKDPISFRARWFQRKRVDPKKCRALYVHGRSMEPVLEDYDTVLIDTSKTQIIDGEIYAVSLGDEFFIKIVERTNDGIVLVSANKEFKDIEIKGEELDQFRVIGMKIWRAG